MRQRPQAPSCRGARGESRSHAIRRADETASEPPVSQVGVEGSHPKSVHLTDGQQDSLSSIFRIWRIAWGAAVGSIGRVRGTVAGSPVRDAIRIVKIKNDWPVTGRVALDSTFYRHLGPLGCPRIV